jgi:hypothetical protein
LEKASNIFRIPDASVGNGTRFTLGYPKGNRAYPKTHHHGTGIYEAKANRYGLVDYVNIRNTIKPHRKTGTCRISLGTL